MESGARNVVLGAVVVVLLSVAGFRMLSSSSSGKLKLPDEVTQEGVCLNCEAHISITRDFRKLPPYKCSACDEPAACPWWYCYECQYRFVPEMVRFEGEPARPSPFPTCPHCGCKSVGAFDVQSGRQGPIADAPLPSWP